MGLNGEPWTCHERRSVMILIRAANERSNLLALIIPLDVGAMNEADTRWMAIALLGVRAATRADFQVIYPVRKATSGRPGAWHIATDIASTWWAAGGGGVIAQRFDEVRRPYQPH